MLEPIVVKIVSNNTESAENSSLAEESVISLSFLHDVNSNDSDRPTMNTIKYVANFFKSDVTVPLYFDFAQYDTCRRPNLV